MLREGLCHQIHILDYNHLPTERFLRELSEITLNYCLDRKLVRHQVPLPRDHDQHTRREIEESLHAHNNLNHHGEPITEENDIEEQAMEEDEAMEDNEIILQQLVQHGLLDA